MAVRGKATRPDVAPDMVFGTGGVPHSARPQSTIGGVARIEELGLGCLELEFVHQVRMGEGKARQVAEAARKAGVRLSVHAPYYINFNSAEPDKVRASQERLLRSARIGWICGAESVIFHAAFYMGMAGADVYATVKKYLAEVVRELDQEDNRIWVRPEVMGRVAQFGTIEEILSLSTEFERVLPALDVAHWHAREGRFNSYPEFATVLTHIEDKLGRRGIENLHVHCSGIKYGKRGELRHLNLGESDFQYRDLLRALRAAGAKGLVVCESPNLEEDALLLKQTYADVSDPR
jgi:deoxyribonuclease-4